MVRAVHGLEQLQREVGHLVTDAKLPTPGQAPSPSYEGEGYIIVQHPETKVVRDALARIVGTVRVERGVNPSVARIARGEACIRLPSHCPQHSPSASALRYGIVAEASQLLSLTRPRSSPSAQR